MTGKKDRRTRNGWTFDIAPGDTELIARHKASGVVLMSRPVLDFDDGMKFRLKAVRLGVERTEANVTDAPPPPIDELEEFANRPEIAQLLLDTRSNPVEVSGGSVPPMRIQIPPGAGKKPDGFYKKVAGYVVLCNENGIKWGPRLAADNGVPISSIYNWVRRARQLGYLSDEEATK